MLFRGVDLVQRAMACKSHSFAVADVRLHLGWQYDSSCLTEHDRNICYADS